MEILTDNDSDLSDVSEESDFYEPRALEEEMSNEKVEDLPNRCEELQQNPVVREFNVE